MPNFIPNNLILILILAAIGLIALWNIILQIRLWRLNKKLKIFFNGRKASDLEGVLFEAIRRLKRSENHTQKIFRSLDELQKLTNQSIKKVSVVRFNPFSDTGSNQSFSIALLDSHNNGLVISSLYTREGTRIYSKPIESGRSKYPLSKEEMEALNKVGIKIKDV